MRRLKMRINRLRVLLVEVDGDFTHARPPRKIVITWSWGLGHFGRQHVLWILRLLYGNLLHLVMLPPRSTAHNGARSHNGETTQPNGQSLANGYIISTLLRDHFHTPEQTNVAVRNVSGPVEPNSEMPQQVNDTFEWLATNSGKTSSLTTASKLKERPFSDCCSMQLAPSPYYSDTRSVPE